MTQDIYRFYLKLFPFSLSLFFLHKLLQYLNVWPISSGYFYGIHVFNFLASAIVYIVLAYAFQKIKDKAGFVYLVLSIIKMLAVMILMAVVILGENNAPQAFALQFMVVYAVYLIFEVFTMVKKLNA